ncbi:hypothetical protein BofuT4_uP013100.1 [Botrytis cinerea T4]|uniref:Uncharacterized protein n=1 Tax=Botryotinia fuckeliana (strain T4) TaxID=999810 RepID=G2XR33_BOTF4|nr:hypothetical protein BofuT4_uP013100.1 [Botrytis cinerea T4]
MDLNTAQTQSPPVKKHQNLQLVPLTTTEHLDDFWEIWREERGVLWSYVFSHFLSFVFPFPFSFSHA